MAAHFCSRLIKRQMSTITRHQQIVESYHKVLAEIAEVAKASGVKPPRLVAVSKYKPVEDIRALYDAGHRHFGENYVQELVTKAAEMPEDIQWHFIGALQSNKCKVLTPISNLYAVETLDSASKADKLNKGRSGRPLHVFIQVNTSGEDQKAGIRDVDEVTALAKHIVSNCPNLVLGGLMTIGSVESSKSDSPNVDFITLADIAKKVSASVGKELELSMGMSSDYLEAIRQGSTNVRVGSAIFGARKTKLEIKGDNLPSNPPTPIAS